MHFVPFYKANSFEKQNELMQLENGSAAIANEEF
jgi:hypothetical protein